MVCSHQNYIRILIFCPFLQAWPYFQVESSLYRFRILQAANSRFFNFSFFAMAAGSNFGNDFSNAELIPTNGVLLTFTVIASDGGYLSAPVQLQNLMLAPAERVTVLVDFSSAGLQVPFDVFVLNNAPVPGETLDAFTNVLMKFVVTTDAIDSSERLSLPPLVSFPDPNPSEAVVERIFGLSTDVVIFGNTSLPTELFLGGRTFEDPITETPRRVRKCFLLVQFYYIDFVE